MKLIIALPFVLISLAGFSQSSQKIDFDQIVIDSANLPDFFDLRNSAFLSPVRTQPNGGCWTSASNTTAEGCLRQAGYGNYIFSDINLQLFSGFDESRKVNGNHLMATAYYSRGSGPIVKDVNTDSVSFIKAIVPYCMTDARFLPNNPNIVKQTIMNFGPVYSMLYFKKEDTDTINHIYYTKIKKINHVVSLVGWNDTLVTIKGRGAWIAQNSLGIKFGDSGFLYIPYQDKNILKHNAVWSNWIPGNLDYDLFYLDTLGSFNSYGFDDTICYGMVEYTAHNDGSLNKIATWINADQTSIKVEVYKDFDKETKVLSGELISEQTTICRFAGYYTFDLLNSLHFVKGDKFYIVIKYSHPINKKPMPVEKYVKDYADPHISAGRCWINPNFQKWPESWYEVGLNSEYDFLTFDLCIRAYYLND